MAASQGKAAARAAEEAVRPAPQRYRVNVPAADEAVQTWMAMQDNHSLSVRLLIRESIERNGYIDVMNKPVDQLPKRGRPTTAGDEQFEELLERQPQQPAPPMLQVLPQPAPAAAVATGDLDLTPEPDREPELLGIALTSPGLVPASASQQVPALPVTAPAPVPSDPEPSSSEQFDVNDIFTSIR